MIAVVKYNAGNIHSVRNALARLGTEGILTDDPAQLRAAEKVIFPGVGEATSTMAYLRDRGLDEVLVRLTQPFLGICLGQQLMCRHSEEGDTKCLGILDADVHELPPRDNVPHMGWNNFSTVSGDLLRNIPIEADMYYVHSYYCTLSPDTIASTTYITEFASAMKKDNFHAVQFHPEKSAYFGQRLLQNFLEL